MKCFIPFAHAKNIYEIDIEFFKRNNFDTIFLDLDNTLDSYLAKDPSPRAKELVNKYLEAGLKVYLISNNHKERVDRYAPQLGLEYTYLSGKPFPFKINKFIKEKGLNKQTIVEIGDQLLTDVLFGKNLGIKVVLTEKLVKEDQPSTRINRLIDIPIRKHLAKKKLLVDWRNK